LSSCYRDATSALELLKSSTSEYSGVIHLRNSIDALYEQSSNFDSLGITFMPESRLNENTSFNHFVRTTQSRQNMELDESSRTYRNTNDRTVYLERSQSASRLYIGSEQNYFERRNDILNQIMNDNRSFTKLCV